MTLMMGDVWEDVCGFRHLSPHLRVLLVDELRLKSLFSPPLKAYHLHELLFLEDGVSVMRSSSVVTASHVHLHTLIQTNMIVVNCGYIDDFVLSGSSQMDATNFSLLFLSLFTI